MLREPLTKWEWVGAVGIVFGFLASTTLVVLVFYIVIHFILKFW